MAKSYPAKTSFNGGVQTPLIQGMVDAPKGDSSFQAGLNGMGIKYGPWVRRSGTKRIATVPSLTNTDFVKLIPFHFNDEQAYVLEFSTNNGRMRVYKDRGLVLHSTDTTKIQTITAIDQPVADLVKIHVSTGTDYTAGESVTISGITSGGTELNGVVGTISSTSATWITVDALVNIWPDFSAGTADGTLTAIYELDIPYSDSDMFDSDGNFRIDVRQINDVMYLAHPDFPVQVLSRTGHDVWAITDMVFNHGPFEAENTNTEYILSLDLWEREDDANANSIWVTKCTAIDKNGDTNQHTTGIPLEIFAATDAVSVAAGGMPSTASRPNTGTATTTGRTLKTFTTSLNNDQGKRWRYMEIIRFVSTSEVWVKRRDDEPGWKTVSGDFWGPPNNANYPSGSHVNRRPSQWALGAFSETTGFPETIEIHAGRLALANTTNQPRRVYMSVAGAFTSTDSDWETADRDGQVYDDLGLALTIGGGNSSPIQWIASAQNGLAVGTSNEEGMLRPSDETKGFVPGSVVYSPETTVGSKSIQPERVNQSTLFISKTGRRVHEMSYDLSNNGQTSPDLTELAEHVTRTGVADFAFKRDPDNILWCSLVDGKLIGLTYDKDANINGWHQHELGGEHTGTGSLLDGEDSKLTSVAVIPSPDGLSEDLWFSVNRNVWQRTLGTGDTGADFVETAVEILQPMFEDGDDIKDARFLDNYLDITAASASKTYTSNGTILSSGFTDGDILFLTNPSPATGFTDDPTDIYVLFDSDQIKSIGGSVLDFGQSFTADTQVATTTFSGVEHLLAKTASIYADGRKLDDQVIVAGSNTLANGEYAANLTIGHGYTSYVELKNLEGGDLSNLAQGKTKRISRVMVRLLNSLGLKYGDSATTLDTYEFDEDPVLSEFVDLKSGNYILDWPGEYEQSGTIRLQGDGPYPLQIQLVVAEMDTQGLSSSL